MSIPPRLPPPLENGDHLTRDEFERRYEAMPHVKKAELINGVVYMPSPVRHEQHGLQHAALLGWLVNYWAATPGTQASDNSTLRLDLENVHQPDALLLIEPARGGAVRFEDGYIVGGPELVAEVAASSVSMDLNTKLQVYLDNGIREYVVWRVLDEAVDWFIRRGDQFVPLAPGADGLLRSETFPGLWLDAHALVHLQLAAVLAVLQQGLASPEHAAFVAHLQQAAGA
jgi:Putative restriction endonuclease